MRPVGSKKSQPQALGLNASQKVKALLPALDLTLNLLKEGYQSADPAKEEAAMTEMNTLYAQIFSYADSVHTEQKKQCQTRLKNFYGDLNQLVKDIKKQNRDKVHQDFAHLFKDLEALKKLF